MHKAVFLDRDGVINAIKLIEGKPFPPNKLEELIILPQVIDSLNKLHSIKYKLIVITNQPDVARGKIPKESVELINKHLMDLLPLNSIYTCFHDDNDHCNCRKPKPGALISEAKKNNIDLSKSFMIGDRWKDIEAGKKAGCKTFFIDNGYLEKQPNDYDFRVSSLYDASLIIENINK